MATMDEAKLRDVMRDLGIRMEDVADRCGVDRSYVSKQLRGERPLSRAVKKAFLDAVDDRAIRALRHVARLLRRHGEQRAAEICERLRGSLARPEARAADPT